MKKTQNKNKQLSLDFDKLTLSSYLKQPLSVAFSEDNEMASGGNVLQFKQFDKKKTTFRESILKDVLDNMVILE